VLGRRHFLSKEKMTEVSDPELGAFKKDPREAVSETRAGGVHGGLKSTLNGTWETQFIFFFLGWHY
jgi:hypothetical protein